ncbi:MAG: formylglycine-generating enzyme family protein, partial [Planctomycetaceae bacterium]|nr:formylglycine-generating enzyme family protein [Planctomycetaceae bacterium]
SVVSQQGSHALGNGRTSVFVPSFLIMRHPVTNGHYLHFLKAAAGHPYRPETYRGRRNNYYYIKEEDGWDEWLSRFGDSASIPLSLETETSEEMRMRFHRWLNHPVVQVTWDAAEACARYYRGRLPAEVEYEATAFAYQHSAVSNESSQGSRFPAISNEWKHSFRVPQIDCTSLEALCDALSKPEEKSLANSLAEAARKQTGFEPPLHLGGLIWEWTADVWQDEWPLSETSMGGVAMYPVNTGIHREPNSERIQRSIRRSDLRSIRGGSLLESPDCCNATQRNNSPSDRCNTDCGFRLAFSLPNTFT